MRVCTACEHYWEDHEIDGAEEATGDDIWSCYGDAHCTCVLPDLRTVETE